MPVDPSSPVSSSLRAKLQDLEERLAAGPSQVSVTPVAPVPEVVEALPEALAPVASVPAQTLGPGARAVVVATVLLLAAAAGMAAAAVVESGSSPEDSQAWLAGGLAAVLVLVLALIVAGVRRKKSSQN